jgi:N-acetyl-gamma-glutamyl-phosphate reductase
VTEETVNECYKKAYGREPFVRLFSPGRFPEIKFVSHTNYCDIGWKLETGRAMLVVISAIDNLVKGAAGQALQNMNVMLGLEETAGLI